jgi:hypothetical protein
MLSVIDKENIRAEFSTATRGTEARVFYVGGKIAKLYACPRNRLMASESQELAAKHGLAPDVYGNFDITINNKEYYGYLSEIVEVLEPELTHNGQIMGCHGEIDYAELSKLKRKLNKIGISACVISDLYENNVGWKDGRMVCIDFGHG